MRGHIYRDGEGVMRDHCIVCGHPRRVPVVDDPAARPQLLAELEATARCSGPAPAIGV